MTQIPQNIGPQEYLYLAAAALALLALLILLLRRQPKKIVAYSTEDGQVFVARSAIKELVQSSCEQLEGVSKPRTRISIKGNCAHFDVQVKLVGSCRLKEVETTLQRHMRRALTENLGIENLGRINVTATGFKSDRVEQGRAQVNPKPVYDTPPAQANSKEERDPAG
ncbi:MAG: alkaline shock response membrane anchor protein AmaP [Opitutales bacterium]